MTTIRAISPFGFSSTAADVIAGIDLHGRRALTYRPDEMKSLLYPRVHDVINPEVGANLRFSSDEPRRGRRRTAGTLASFWTGEDA